MSFESLLIELRREYIEGLAAKVTKMRALQDSIVVGQAGELEIVIRTEVHNLKGSGKTYGVSEVSTLSESYSENLDLAEFSQFVSLIEKVQKQYERQLLSIENAKSADADVIPSIELQNEISNWIRKIKK